MLDLLTIYWTSIVGCVFLGCGLSLLGAQLAARDRSMQTMCISQGAMLGILLGIGLNQTCAGSLTSEFVVSMLLSSLTAAATYFASECLVSGKSSANTHFAALFAVLIAGAHIVSALFPALENHMAQKYFGDLAVMSSGSAWMAMALGTCMLSWLMYYQGRVTRDSFSIAILGANRTASGGWFSVGTLVVLCLSVQIVGFLFAIACLFLPTSILSFSRNQGLRTHLVACALVSAIACSMGFVVTLWQSSLPTVPTIVLTLGLV
jgi:hypothetical protein